MGTKYFSSLNLPVNRIKLFSENSTKTLQKFFFSFKIHIAYTILQSQKPKKYQFFALSKRGRTNCTSQKSASTSFLLKYISDESCNIHSCFLVNFVFSETLRLSASQEFRIPLQKNKTYPADCRKIAAVDSNKHDWD